MWEYMKEKAGNHQHTFKDATVYCNVDAPREEADAEREKAVRKVVRTIIESNGGDGKTIKTDIETDYKKGIVWWKDERVAEWKDDKMNLKGAAASYATAFDKFMGNQ